MAEWLNMSGAAVAFMGAALAVALSCSGSAHGVGTVGRAGAGMLSVDPGKFSRVLILQLLPGMQGLFGLVVWFLALMKLGMFGGGGLITLTMNEGLKFFGACMPMAVAGLVCGIAQGKLCAGGISSLLAKKPGELSKTIILAIMVEFYAILSLLATFLMLNSF